MKRWLKWLVIVLVLLAIAGFVMRSVKARKTEQAALSSAASAVPVLELNAADLIVARQQDMQPTLAVSGGLKAVNSAFVKARVAAEVKALSVREGDAVKAGQVIGTLDSTEFDLRLRQAEQTAFAAKAQVDMAQRTLSNNRALVAQGFISPTGLDTSISMQASAQASYLASAAAVELARKSRRDAQLVAPISGIVSQRLVQPGERVAIDTRLVEIVDLSRLELEAAMAPEDVVNVRVGQAAQLDVDGRAQPLAARVSRINPSTQAGTRAVMVYLAIDNADASASGGLRQGLFARGAIKLERQSALLVPATVVRIDQARPYVLAVVDGKVSQRSVSLGARGEITLDGRTEAAVELTGAAVAPGTTLLRGTVGQVRDGTAVKIVSAALATAPAPAPAPVSAPASAPAAASAAAAAVSASQAAGAR